MNTQPTVVLTDPDAATSPLFDATADTTTDPTTPGPRTRWAAIVWGVFFAAVSWIAIWVLCSPARRDDVSDWFAALTPGTITAVSLLSVGVLVLVAGLVGLIRRMQRRRHP